MPPVRLALKAAPAMERERGGVRGVGEEGQSENAAESDSVLTFNLSAVVAKAAAKCFWLIPTRFPSR